MSQEKNVTLTTWANRVVTTDNVYEIWNDAPSQSYIPVRRQVAGRLMAAYRHVLTFLRVPTNS